MILPSVLRYGLQVMACLIFMQLGCHSQMVLEQPAMTYTKKPPPQLEFLKGPSVQPPKALLAWLRSTERSSRARPVLRVPVVIPRGGHTQFEVQDPFIEGTGDPAGEPPIYLDLDDTRMGIPLSQHLIERCRDDEGRCHVWLEGQWGAMMPLGIASISEGPPLWPFTVSAVVGAPDETMAEGPLSIWVEAH